MLDCLVYIIWTGVIVLAGYCLGFLMGMDRMKKEDDKYFEEMHEHYQKELRKLEDNNDNADWWKK